jgi:hypothetical protein
MTVSSKKNLKIENNFVLCWSPNSYSNIVCCVDCCTEFDSLESCNNERVNEEDW